MNPDINSNDSFLIPSSRGAQRKEELRIFSEYLKTIQRRIGFKISSRGWCYQLETFNLINKGEFDKIQKIINEARKRGFLPLDFVAEEKAREWSGIGHVTKEDPRSYLYRRLRYMKTPSIFHYPDYWYKEEYYIQMLVEKVDLVTLFSPICKKFHIPIANSVGWSSILQRAEMVARFVEYEDKGHTPVLLYCGDFDPFGLAISQSLRKNIKDLSEGTGWSPKNLIIDRFGLNYEFIMENQISWIDNLISGTGKKPDKKNPIVKEYIEKYGERKVEANAIVVRPREARLLCYNTIVKYLGDEGELRMSNKKRDIEKEYNELVDEIDLISAMDDLMEKLEEGGDIIERD